MKHKKDKYGCIDENCKEHYPVIPRKSIIAEMDASEEWRELEENKSQKELLTEFAEYCHEHYRGCSNENGIWFYSYDNEIINYIDDFISNQKD